MGCLSLDSVERREDEEFHDARSRITRRYLNMGKRETSKNEGKDNFTDSTLNF